MKPKIAAMNRLQSLSPDAAQQRAHALLSHIERAIAEAGGWIPFDRYMELALYAPGLGYYAADPGVLGAWGGTSDFVTAPELTPLFAATLARQVADVSRLEDLDTIVECGAGSGRLVCDLLAALDVQGWLPRQYAIVEVSAAMRARQQDAVAGLPEHLRDRITWWDALPDRFDGVVIGNEVLDAMPVKLAVRTTERWLERGVTFARDAQQPLRWVDRATALEPRPSMQTLPPGAVTELHLASDAFVATLGERLGRGLLLFLDYGFPAHEYDHPQRACGTLRCHRAHRAHDDPLWQPGTSDITAHVNFSSVAQAAASVGLDVLGYTSQARFLLNCGLLDLLGSAVAAGQDGVIGAPRNRAGLAQTAAVQRLLSEAEMGELFKVIALARGLRAPLMGFVQGDRSAALRAHVAPEAAY
ncbi:class I SAM-dependent methyltransferase [Thiomonas sp. FB-Cd]|uniref:class I SAM-dependent methyltransferase n=1 Tax=Thiomonas sp. FB-Cd TaxID=1158292 RepID=UPI001E5279FB|nr:SAM-dependent methyltransferase [Thiomonas sp. FB-Cd]